MFSYLFSKAFGMSPSHSAHNTPHLSIPNKVENTNYADSFDSRIITTVFGRKQGTKDRKRKWKKSVRFHLFHNTLHRYDWWTLGHDDFLETLAQKGKCASMEKYKNVICHTLPKEACPCRKGDLLSQFVMGYWLL
ncbi:hypothetical protein L873DRAFT_1788233 [Choiromyces venosus 120613-1]|uniref:Uncharacterized protein n=1 Tax=Choiromyces venosus 120613-1 TaxID=1336337 RepID=A0A3N4JXK8_9PEZI|nr:hypothetical protein L873DRAFT_1788233 [Choiromyces venosus 120613-1]